MKASGHNFNVSFFNGLSMSEISKVLLATSMSLFSANALAAGDCHADKFLVLNYQGKVFDVSRGTIETMPQKEIATSTYWENLGTYRGPLLSDVVNIAVPKKDKIKALNIFTWDNFKSQIPTSDLGRYAPILATHLDNKPLRLEDWGPLYIMYPYDDYRDLRRPAGLMKFAWQVCRIDIE